MNDFRIISGPPHESNDDVTFVVFVDGNRIPEPTHTLEVDSFFKAAISLAPLITFVGTCGDLACCGLGMKSQVTVAAWLWDDYAVSWPDACQSATHILNELELGRYRCSVEELEQYKDAFQQMKQYVSQQ